MWYYVINLLLFFNVACSLAPAKGSLSQQNLCKYALEKRKTKRQLAATIDRCFSFQSVLASQKNSTQDPFITDTEIEELQIHWLMDTLDYTQTAFGRRHLEQSAQLITADVSTIQERQRIIRLLYQDSELLQTIQNMLYAIANRQEHLLSYFNTADHLNYSAQDLYFNGSSIDWINKKAGNFIKKGNNRSSTLSLGIIGSIIKRCDSILISLCQQSMADEIIKIALGISTTLNLDSFLFENIVNTVKGHLPWFQGFNPKTYKGDHDVYRSIMQGGTFGDKLGAYLCGSTAEDTYIGFKYLPIRQRWNMRKREDFTSWSNVSWHSKTIATLILAGWTLYKDYRTIEDGKDSVKKIQQLFRVMNALRKRLREVGHIIKIIQELSTTLAAYPEISNHTFVQSLHTINAITSTDKWNELFALLKKTTFSQDKGNMYNYGVVLRAQMLLNDIKQELIPTLNAVGELDAYCSIATLLHEHEQGAAHFSFVDFVESKDPYIYLENCWVPLINPHNVVTNDIMLGVHGWGNKIIITGPNGCGKSTYLKGLGHALFLAHIFGIVPASSGSITPYTGLRTCFHPRESLSEDMSQFMVEKQCMDTLKEYVIHYAEDYKVLLLIDEPYRGTVDAESAQRIYDFGKNVSQIPQASVVIATHVYKPIILEKETNGIFTNCQVIINQLSDTLFERTFKIIPDVAYWWFADATKRAHFVDWLAADTSLKKINKKAE